MENFVFIGLPTSMAIFDNPSYIIDVSVLVILPQMCFLPSMNKLVPTFTMYFMMFYYDAL